MNTRKLSLAILSIAALAPIVASASPEQVAVKACAKAFATSIAGGASAPAFKLSYEQKHSIDAVAGYYVRNFYFTLQARDPKTGRVGERNLLRGQPRRCIGIDPGEHGGDSRRTLGAAWAAHRPRTAGGFSAAGV